MESEHRDVYTQEEVTAIIRRALSLQGSQEKLSFEELEEIARQSGVAPWRLREAIVLEREARDLDAARDRVESEKPRIWRNFAIVEFIVLALMLGLMAVGEVGPVVLIGWTIGILIGVALVSVAISERRRRIFQRLRDRRAAREAAEIRLSSMDDLKNHSGGVAT